MSEVCATVEGLSKKFCRNLKRSLWYGLRDLTAELFLRRGDRTELRKDEFWALKDISFELRRGEMLGVIGHNGAGKSTLLRLFNGLIKPDCGAIRVWGDVGALIALGMGFNPILTGRENIYINGAILGFSKRQMDEQMEDIIDFAELRDFIDAPVLSYSSGMKVRLGFSVAASMKPDLLLIDEVLSVGDSSFRERCYRRLNEYRQSGGTIILVSHNTAAVEHICDRVILLDHGKMIESGDPTEVVEHYETMMMELSRQANHRMWDKESLGAVDGVKIGDIEYCDLQGNVREQFAVGEPFEIRLHYEFVEEMGEAGMLLLVRKGADTTFISSMNMCWDGLCLRDLPRHGVIGCRVESHSFSPGAYSLVVAVQATVTGAIGKKWINQPRCRSSFVIHSEGLRAELPNAPAPHMVSEMPPVILPHTWTLNGEALARRSGLPTPTDSELEEGVSHGS